MLSGMHPDAAGVDIGAEEIFVAVPADRDVESVRSFDTFTRDLHQLADWLQLCRVQTVAMESTGVYWIPLYQILETRCFQVFLVNAQHVKNVPGRKSEVSSRKVKNGAAIALRLGAHCLYRAKNYLGEFHRKFMSSCCDRCWCAQPPRHHLLASHITCCLPRNLTLRAFWCSVTGKPAHERKYAYASRLLTRSRRCFGPATLPTTFSSPLWHGQPGMAF